MTAILILFIISVQAAIVYFGVKGLSDLNEKIINLNNKVILILPEIQPTFEKTRKVFKQINLGIEGFFKHQNKIKVYRNIMLLKSVAVAILLFKKRKSIISFFSLYDIVSKFTKSILEF